jgi:sugar transferase (PEP-CTERM/EpsH1 system associated)
VSTAYRSKISALLSAAYALLTDKPLSVAAFQRRELAKQIKQRLNTERFDIIFVSSVAMAEYVLPISNVPRVIDFVDVDSEKWWLYSDYHTFPVSWIYQLEAKRLAKYEKEVARTFDHSILISDAEHLLLEQKVSDRPISVISNGVDLEYFSSQKEVPSSSDCPAIVFTGNMDYFPNIDAVRYFCTEIFPLVRQAVPEVQFSIVGRNPTKRVRELGNHPNVNVTGSVPDVRPYLAKATIAVAPFRVARGVQNKILEAMAMELPVVGTSLAFEGIAATEEDGIRIVDDPKRFAQAVVTFLKGDTELRRQYGLLARRFVEEHHRWHDQGMKLEHLLQELVAAPTENKVSLVAADSKDNAIDTFSESYR